MTVTTELMMLDPTSLTLDDNVRTSMFDPGKDPEDAALVESVTAHGVLQPIVAWIGEDAMCRVLYGRRRTLAAAVAGLPSVPVHIVGGLQEADRIARQISENDQRRDLTTAERATGWQQLAALGIPVAEIAAGTGHQPDQVEAGIRVAKNKTAVRAATRYDLTIEQAAAVEEFAKNKEAVQKLTSTAEKDPTRFTHAVQALRDARDEDTEKAALTAKLEAAGTTVVAYGTPPGQRPLEDLYAAGTREVLTRAGHRKCPGHAARVSWQRSWQAKGPAGKAIATYVCTDPTGNGHVHRYAGTSPRGGTLTEQEKADRRATRANRAAWASATTVRRQWLTDYYRTGRPPKNAAGRIAARLLAFAGDGGSTGYTACQDFLNALDNPAARDLIQQLLAALPVTLPEHGDDRPHLTALAVLLAAGETHLTQDSWRHRTATAHWYLQTLTDLGYALSDVELLALAPGAALPAR
jgi:ParB family chromosome partitioning protein